MATDGRNELYSKLAKIYSDYQEEIVHAESSMYNSILLIVVCPVNQTKTDALPGFIQSYETLGSPSAGVISAVRALSIHVLKTNNLPSINDYLEKFNIKVTYYWTFLSNLAGYPIDERFIGEYDEEPIDGEEPNPSQLNPSQSNPSQSSPPQLNPSQLNPSQWDAPVEGRITPTFLAQFNVQPNLIVSKNIFAHPVWDYEVLVPYIGIWWESGTTDALISDPVNKGIHDADAIKVVMDYWYTLRPDRPFKWGQWSNGWGSYDRTGSNLYKFFTHPLDKINAGGTLYNSVWSYNLLSYWSSWGESYYTSLKNRLVQLGVPDPIYLDHDYEKVDGSLLVGPVSGGWDLIESNAALLYYKNDRITRNSQTVARYYEETIDGRITLEQFVNDYRDLDGRDLPESELFPIQYDISLKGSKEANFHASVSSKIRDWVLWKTAYENAKSVFPNIKCGNYNYMCATREYPTTWGRYRESSVDFNENHMRADVSTLSYFGAGAGWDAAQIGWQQDGTYNWGYKQYYELIDKFGISPISNPSRTPTDFITEALYADFEFNCRNLALASPSKKQAIWLSILQSSLSSFNSSYFPSDIGTPNTVNFLYNLEFAKYQMRMGAQYGIEYYGIFDPIVTGGSTSSANYVMNLLQNIIEYLPTAGYNLI